MAKATVGAAGLEYIQGALKRPKKSNGHNHGNYLVMTHRTAPTTSESCQRIYSFSADRYKRSTPFTQEDLARQLRFRTVSAAVAARMKDPAKMIQDQAAFNAQTTYKTMKSYIWALEKAAYDANLNG